MRPINHMLTEVGEPTVTSYIILDKCYRCENLAKSYNMDRISLSEYRITGFCVKCQDHIYNNLPTTDVNTSRYDNALEKVDQLLREMSARSNN